MKSLLFVIPWKASLVNEDHFVFAEAPERAPENVVNLASYLIKQGAAIEIADMTRFLVETKGSVDGALDLLRRQCERFNPDVIGLSFFTARFEFAARIVEFLYSIYPHERPLIIAGGVHPTLLPKVTYQYINFDALIIGEGEIPLTNLLKGESLDSISGVFLPGQDKPSAAPILRNLDELPFSDWNLVDHHFYIQPSYQISNTRLDSVMPITFGRSCMYRCHFCAHNSFLKPRCHTPEYFLEMMRHTEKQCGVNTFIIQDSSIGSYKREWIKVCKLLVDAGSPYRWWANLRANQVDEDFLRLIKEAGGIKLFFGFESGSQRILDRMNKRETVEQLEQAAELCHKVGIPFYTSYIVNYFGEEDSDLEATERLILKTRPTSLSINTFSPIPGSVDYDTHADIIEPLLKTIHDWSMLGMLFSPLLFGNMTEERYKYWYKRLKDLKYAINSNEDI